MAKAGFEFFFFLESLFKKLSSTNLETGRFLTFWHKLRCHKFFQLHIFCLYRHFQTLTAKFFYLLATFYWSFVLAKTHKKHHKFSIF